jgi:hypothetical protein
LWYVYSVPSVILHAVSPDLYNWYPDKKTALDYTKTMFGLVNSNQAADTSLLDMGNKVYMYYDGTDNTTPGAAIGVAIFPGRLSELGECGYARGPASRADSPK